MTVSVLCVLAAAKMRTVRTEGDLGHMVPEGATAADVDDEV